MNKYEKNYDNEEKRMKKILQHYQKDDVSLMGFDMDEEVICASNGREIYNIIPFVIALKVKTPDPIYSFKQADYISLKIHEHLKSEYDGGVKAHKLDTPFYGFYSESTLNLYCNVKYYFERNEKQPEDNEKFLKLIITSIKKKIKDIKFEFDAENLSWWEFRILEDYSKKNEV